jgi:hypothetical protein
VSSGTPLLFERYTWTGRDYFKVLNESRYLSVSNGGQVGLYDWNGARTFQKESTWLFSDENGQQLQLRTNGEVWCGHEGELLEETFVPA